MNSLISVAPPDQADRNVAVDPQRSILVQAPAGSGKTDLLTRRFLRLLAEVDEPGQIVAITFTIAAAAEMRLRILSELEKASALNTAEQITDLSSMAGLARRAYQRSHKLNWRLLDLPTQLRISTIDSFCRELALRQPLLSGVGAGLQINDLPDELYRAAARRTLESIGGADLALAKSIEEILMRRDNGWHEMEKLLIEMLRQRDRWMHDFVLQREQDWDALRTRLERPFANAVRQGLTKFYSLLQHLESTHADLLELARFACEHSDGLYRDLAEIAEFPAPPFMTTDELEDARQAYTCLANMLLTEDDGFRAQVNKTHGFPPEHKDEKEKLLDLIENFRLIDQFESALAAVRSLPPARYIDDDWQIIRACFTLLRHAVGQLRILFAESGTVDFIDVAQIAQHVLRDAEGQPTDAALAEADGVHHLLVDEFQDTSRRQHQLLASLVAAWPDQSNRTLFMVGDPMQSIYFFRDADAELFPRVRTRGLELSDNEIFHLDPVQLKANFRTEPDLVDQLNESFAKIFTKDDGSNVTFSRTEPARDSSASSSKRLQLHLEFVPQPAAGRSGSSDANREKLEAADLRETARQKQVNEIVAVIASHLPRMDRARARGNKYRIAVLGRTRAALAPVAEALRESAIPFRAIDLESLKDRPEILDAISLARALLNPNDRVAWLGVLRAPWCGLSLEELYMLVNIPGAAKPVATIPDLLIERLHLLNPDASQSVQRVLSAFESAPRLRAGLPTASLGTVLEQVWLNVGGDRCVDSTARANLNLLWNRLDHLPQGEQDLHGTGLDLTLDALFALPDPSASSDCGVQLMTIHKSKGLEFEVVIVPDLHAGKHRGQTKLLSWLERGLAEPDISGEITEFLVAPLQPKGADRGKAKAWVDRVYCEREAQEMRRILYVAATRARDELHLFARPAYRRDSDDLMSLVTPSNCLLATAWPAFESEIREQFEKWKQQAGESNFDNHQLVLDFAAAAESNLAVMPAQAKPTTLRRLPPDFNRSADVGSDMSVEKIVGTGSDQSYERHPGGMASRALGSAVHRLLEELARLRERLDWNQAREAIAQWEPRILAQIRSSGMERSQAASIAAKSVDIALKACKDTTGRWILSPHTEAASEAGLAGVVNGDLSLVRVDRIFRAGAEPTALQENVWWIIDFKTAHADNVNPAITLPEFRRKFGPQLETYAAIMRKLHGPDAQLRAGLYYPRMSLFDWWEI